MNAPLAAEDQRFIARSLYWQGWRICRIAEELDIPRTTIDSWKTRDAWDQARPIDRVEGSLEARLVQLINKDNKEGKDFKEIDLLGRQVERLARVRRYEVSHNEADLNPKVANRNRGPRKKPARNEISEDAQIKLIEAFNDQLFDYQKVWQEAAMRYRIRNLLKSRQIGATYYFAFEALVDALETGRNQVFLSASKAQAHVFKQYIVQFAKEYAETELTGDPIILPNGAHLYFLGTNARTAQGYHGNVYMDEYFWIHKFQEFRKVASGMAMHSKWRQTYFSTPSSITHGAYTFWNGDHANRGRPKDQRLKIDISHGALSSGLLCADEQWRQIVTVEDAVRGGCSLFNLAQLRLEYSPDEYANLLMCQFIDDTASVFPLTELQPCMVDSWEEWEDYKRFSPRPFGDRAVWVGYDPSLNGDSAGCIVLGPPLVPGGAFRVLEKHQWRGMDFAAQSEAIRQITLRYRVTYIGIDATGIGQGVYQLVKQFFPAVRQISYSPEIKSRLVLKAKDVITRRRLQFDAGWTDLAQSFMAIRKTTTASGSQVTYEAGRSDDIGHADLAWACMHALYNEPLEGGTKSNSGFMEIFS